MSDKTQHFKREMGGEEKSVVPPPDNHPEEDRVSSDPRCFPRGLDFCSPSPNLADATVIVSRGSGQLQNSQQLASTLKQAKGSPTEGSRRGRQSPRSPCKSTLDSASNLLCCAKAQPLIQQEKAKTLRNRSYMLLEPEDFPFGRCFGQRKAKGLRCSNGV